MMDFLLTDSNGIPLTRELKSSESNLDSPVIMLTGRTGKHVVVESRKAGVVDFVAKPWSWPTDTQFSDLSPGNVPWNVACVFELLKAPEPRFRLIGCD